MTSILGKRKAPSSSSSSSAAAQTVKPLSTSSGKKSVGAVKTATATPSLKKRKKSLETVRKPASATKKTTAKSNKVGEKQEGEEEADEPLLSAQEIFRRHFEAQFKPIGEPGRKKGKKKAKAKAAAVEVPGGDADGGSDSDGDVEVREGSDEDVFEDEGADGQEGEGEEWSGLSGEDEDDSGSDEEEGDEEEEEDEYEDDDGENPVIEVVDHTNSKPQPVASMSKRELKAFMSSKPPSQTDPNPSAAPAAPADPDDENDKSMLANDLALQRLLSESHLLSRHTITPFSNPTAASKTFSEGKLRQRQTDLRTQALARGVSGVSSLFTQEKMPMAFRKGMVAVAANKEAKRRQQARENGIVLEREVPAARGKKAKKAGRRGERGVDGPEVGRMRGAELRLSERDVQNIEGSGGGRGGRGGRGGGRGRGR
ncbi:Protein FAF1, partial [Colletotrichum shisoi]